MKQGWGITFEAPKWSRQPMNPERASRGGLVRQTLIPRTSSQCDAKNMSGLSHTLVRDGNLTCFWPYMLIPKMASRGHVRVGSGMDHPPANIRVSSIKVRLHPCHFICTLMCDFRNTACLQSNHVHDHLGGVFYVLRARRYF